MASRSGGTTGILVALVVFVVLSVSLLAVSIVLYAGKSSAEVAANRAQSDLNSYIDSEQRDRPETKLLLGADGKTLFQNLTERQGAVSSFVLGDANADIGVMRTALGVAADSTVKDSMRKLQQDRDARAQEATSLKAKSNDLTKEVDALKAKLVEAEAARESAIAAITGSIASYQQAAEGYRSEFDAAKASLDQSRTDIEARFSSETSTLQSEIDDLRTERGVLDSRIGALQRKVDSTSTKAANPAALVDARVVDIDIKTGTVFIDIGSNRRVVPGMTFELFDDAAGIVAAANNGTRGKASIQVTKVGDTTSTCRVLRAAGARPIVKDDVAANAVFNPDYKFKFLVHGKFDVNSDGKPTTGEADDIASRIREWGGEVIVSETLTGDLDFLVLGVQPPFPAPLPSDATEAQTLSYTDQRNARESYDRFFQTASDAQIPVLNWARFEALTGTVNR